MAKVSLRIYNRELENLIDQGQLDEAIAHCHHILKTFPKHLETYRLLGKAFLEAKRYNEAVDIFSRILAAVPEDFVSHVGMSIINDEQNKLDAAIWHMERAFEVQPSNAAIQGELQRLYGRRDGVEPPKIRMTRGALAHMYMQGELYPQAISEIRAVLQQDPQRVDMQVLLARAFFHAGQKAEASDMCAQLLKRYPYSLDANRILVDLLPGTDRAESTQVYRLRVYELDPYAAFVQGSVFKSNEVPDAAVSLERLEYTGQEVIMQQDWGASLGIGLTPDATAFDQEPDWLKGGNAPEAEPKDEIPDFMRQAGWTESSGAVDQSLSPFAADDESELAPADLPDWMKAMAPSASAQQPPPPKESEEAPPSSPDSETPDWLASLGALGAGSASNTPPPESASPLGASDDTDLPDWLKNLSTDEPAPLQPEPSSEVPDWLRGAQGEGTSAGVDETSDWLKNLGAQEPEAVPPAESPAETPDWLKNLDAEKPAEPQPPAPQKAPPSLESLGASAQEQEDAVSWLESLAAKHGAKPEELVTDPDKRSEKPPEWVEQARAAAEAQPQMEEDQTGMWLRGLDQQDQLTPKKPTPEDQETKDWLAGLADAVSQPADDESFSDWNLPHLDEQAPASDEMNPAAPEEPQEPTFKETPLKETPASADLPDWLRGFERQSEKPVQAGDELPSWLSEEEGELRPEPEPEPEPTAPSDWQPVEPEERQTPPPAPAPARPKAAKSTSRAAARQPKAETKTQKGESTLSQAQNELNRGDIPAAMEQYNKLIRKGRFLEEAIRDLREALYRYPIEVSVWQTLGDAYMRANRLQEALDAYTKAEELLR